MIEAPDDAERRARLDAAGTSELARLGYAQELLRRMSGFSSFAVSFSIISVLTGCITAYGDALGPGGPAALGIGWPLVSIGTIVVALAMAELASAFPTAGALYHWSALLGGPGWGWMTAAINIVGQIAIVAAIDYGCASELAATLGLGPTAALGLLAVVLASHAVVNVLSVRLVAWLNDFSAVVHVLGVALLVALLFALGHPRSPRFLFDGSFTNRADGNTTLGFANGLVLSLFTFTGYDASAHLSEETKDPARAAPKGIVTSVLVSAVAGYLLLVAITLAIRDLPTAANDPHAALYVMRTALGDGVGRLAMALAIAAMWFCGLSSVTSASRTLWAFSRDGGMPGSRLLARVHVTTRTPHVAIVVVTASPLALVLATAPFEGSLFAAMAKMATMGLYVSYALPIALGAVARWRGLWTKMGPFHLGRFGTAIAAVAVAWSVGVLVICSLPPNQLPAEMLAGAAAALGALFLLFMRGRFRGPSVKLADVQTGPHGGD